MYALKLNWGIAWASPMPVRVLLDHHFLGLNDRKWTPNLTSSCATWKFFVVSKIYHIWLLDHRVTESMWHSFPEEPCLVVGSSMFQKYVTKFPEWLYMVNGLLVLRKHVTRFYWIAIVIWWQMMASITKILLHKFPDCWQVTRKYASCG